MILTINANFYREIYGKYGICLKKLADVKIFSYLCTL